MPRDEEKLTSTQILKRAASLIEKKGLARGCAMDSTGAFCLGAALVESSYYNKKFQEKAYTQAKVLLCGRMGITASYDALVDWNDSSFVTKKGELRYRHAEADALREIRETIATTS